MSKYTDYVKAHIGSAPGATQKEKMRAVAAMWRKQKGSGALMEGGCCKGEGARGKTKSRLEGGSGKRTGHALAAAAPDQQLFHGGMVDLRPVNEVGVQGGAGFLGDIFPPAKLFGLGADMDEDMDGGKVSFNDVVNGIGTVAKTAGALAPLAMLLL